MNPPGITETTNERYEVSMDPARLDLDFISRMLATSYWAAERPRAKIEASIRASLCFGAYERTSGRQVGFARIVTDGATFSWLCDVIVDETKRGSGVGKLLMGTVVAHPTVRSAPCLLATRDAHGLYEKFGFTRSEAMRRLADKLPGA